MEYFSFGHLQWDAMHAFPKILDHSLVPGSLMLFYNFLIPGKFSSARMLLFLTPPCNYEASSPGNWV